MSASPEMRQCPSSTNSSIMRAIATSLMLVDEESKRFHPWEEQDQYCRTPKAAEFRIPTVEICPPAPKKRKTTVLPCRRNLQVEIKFIRVNHEETRGLFQRLFSDLTTVKSSSSGSSSSSRSRSCRKRKHCCLGGSSDQGS